VINAHTGPKRSTAALRHAIQDGERILLSSLVLYEWSRGPRLPQELAAQESLFPSETAIPFDWQESALSAKLYRFLHGAAACAITHEATLWTLNGADFKDIPGLRLYVSR